MYSIIRNLSLPTGVFLISPVGSNTEVQVCENVIALVKDGKKYWLSPEEKTALGEPSWTEVSMLEFQSYPDGTSTIVINGVTIPARSTLDLCSITPPINLSGKSNLILYGIIATVGLGAIMMMRKKSKPTESI